MTSRSRWIWTLWCLTLASCTRAAATKPAEGYEVGELRYEGNAGYVSPIELAEDLGYLAPLKLNYAGNNSTGGPHSIAAVLSGDLDFGSSFNGAIIKLVATKAPIRSVVAAYGTDEKQLQGFYVLEDSPVRTARDLLGKKVSVNTLGAHVEFALKEYLVRNRFTPEEIRQVTMVVTPSINGEMALREKQVDAAALGLIFRVKALERGGIRALFTDQELFGTFNAGSYVMSQKFIAKRPKATRKFVEAVGKAIDWSRAHTREEVIARMEAIIKRRQRNEDPAPVRSWHSYGVSSPGGRLSDRDFQLWIDWLVRDGQFKPGQLKPADVYVPELQVLVDRS
jgi:ABC-type nitrate/sulfonate/bicarbonate transport system substrate-binding protein